MSKIDKQNQVIKDIIKTMAKERELDDLTGEKDRKLILRDAPPYEAVDIWCHKCHKDYKIIAQRVINKSKAWYEGKCKFGHRNYRNILDKHLDPYFRESKSLIMEIKQYLCE
jgi:hypothetical protein